jgi:hypothetical protein
MREKLSDEYTPRGRHNITEEDDWKKCHDMNEDNKELLEELQPETVKKNPGRKNQIERTVYKENSKRGG